MKNSMPQRRVNHFPEHDLIGFMINLRSQSVRKFRLKDLWMHESDSYENASATHVCLGKK